MKERKIKEKIERTLENMNACRDELEELKSLIDMLFQTLRRYQELVDLSTMLPKERFMRYRLGRIVKRISYTPEKTLVGVRIFFDSEVYKSVRDVLVSYVDSVIRPTDIIFLFNDDSVGIIYIIDKKPGSKLKAIERLEDVLSNLAVELENKTKKPLKWRLITTELREGDDVDSFLARLKAL